MAVLGEVRVLDWILAGRIDVRKGRITAWRGWQTTGVVDTWKLSTRCLAIGKMHLWKKVLLILRGEKKIYFLVSLKKVVYLLNTSDFKIHNMGATLAPGCLRHITSWYLQNWVSVSLSWNQDLSWFQFFLALYASSSALARVEAFWVNGSCGLIFWLFSLTCTRIHIQHIYNTRTHGLTSLGRDIWRLSSPRSSSSAFWFAPIGLQIFFSFHSAKRFGDYVFFNSFFLLGVFFFFTQTLSLAFSHLHSHIYFFFRALGDFSFTASRWRRSLLLGL